MSVIKMHDVTLYGGNQDDIVLRPLSEDDIPVLYRLNNDPDIPRWRDDRVEPYDIKTAKDIYSSVSQNAFCFIIEVNQIPIGECRLQKINIADIVAIYDQGTDVRRINLMIVDKSNRGHGYGTQVVGMLLDFAFTGEHTDVLYCICDDYNIRSNRILMKYGFSLVFQKAGKGESEHFENHYCLTRQGYIHRRRYRPDESDIFTLPLSSLQPSQLYISDGKLQNVREWFNPSDTVNFDPIPLKRLCGRLVMTDGHTRAVAAYLAGWNEIPVHMDTSKLDMSAYETDIRWCDEAGIHMPADLAKRIVSHKDYERLWRKRCMEM
ncbi:MAG: GNAT family N-acetyltransferase [Clostridiaceae bacterium]|nr:GNAT family N-acetyltransferase [Clostridiaceae bacterium]